MKKPKKTVGAKKSRKANEKPESAESASLSQKKKSKAGNLFAKGKKSAESEDLIADRGSRITGRDAVRAKTIESHNRRP
jgi:hypothetical protein